MRAFLLSWNAGQEVPQSALLAFLDTRRAIKNYYVPYTGTVLMITDDFQTPSTLEGPINDRFPGLLFAIAPADHMMIDGRMPQLFWDLVRAPKSSGRWPSSESGSLGALADLLRIKKETKK